jgi:hypothetical protein
MPGECEDAENTYTGRGIGNTYGFQGNPVHEYPLLMPPAWAWSGLGGLSGPGTRPPLNTVTGRQTSLHSPPHSNSSLHTHSCLLAVPSAPSLCVKSSALSPSRPVSFISASSRQPRLCVDQSASPLRRAVSSVSAPTPKLQRHLPAALALRPSSPPSRCRVPALSSSPVVEPCRRACRQPSRQDLVSQRSLRLHRHRRSWLNKVSLPQ